jgi:glutathione synthase/RimK-type ligase-like ATP-grasp enzyme
MLANRGLDLIFGDQLSDGHMSGFRATTAAWEPVHNIRLDGAHDRFPSQLRAQRYSEIQAGLGDVVMGNPLGFTMLCRDKLKSQRKLESIGVSMPELITKPEAFESALKRWGSGFIKPRYGALGIGVARVVPGDALPKTIPGMVQDNAEPALLQQAISPPDGWASRTVRVLLQRQPHGDWVQATPVVRQSRIDPVANAARGAQVVAGPWVLDTQTLNQITETSTTIANALDELEDSDWILEAGIDLVLDQDHHPWLIEINSRPRGRMEMLADTNPDKYLAAHIAAAARPIERIRALITQKRDLNPA